MSSMHFIIILFMFLYVKSSDGRILYFGTTHSGKTTLINSCCNLNLPVVQPNQDISTTKDITSYPCLGTHVIDTIGIFDYHPDQRLRFGVIDVLTIILENAAKEGLSGIFWVWSTKNTVRNHELEEIFKTLRNLLPNVIPMAVVKNVFPHCDSSVPGSLANDFSLELLTVSKNDVEPLKTWIKNHNENFRIELPSDWKEYLVKHDINTNCWNRRS